MRVVDKHMGEAVRMEFALSIRVLNKMLGHLDHKWNEGRLEGKRKEVVEIVWRRSGQNGYGGIYDLL